MDAIELLVRSLPAAAERIGRLYGCDLEFRGVCEDYRDCVVAQRRFARADPARAEDYRRLAAELLAEVIEMLKAGRPGTPDLDRGIDR